MNVVKESQEIVFVKMDSEETAHVVIEDQTSPVEIIISMVGEKGDKGDSGLSASEIINIVNETLDDRFTDAFGEKI